MNETVSSRVVPIEPDNRRRRKRDFEINDRRSQALIKVFDVWDLNLNSDAALGPLDREIERAFQSKPMAKKVWPLLL